MEYDPPNDGQYYTVVCVLLPTQSVQLSKGSHPYSCSSLGKRLLKYKAPASHDSSTNSNGGDPAGEEDTSSSSHLNTSKESEDLTVTIPESVLTWKGDRGSPGTQMLVFQVSYANRGPVSKPKRKPLQLINFVSQKGCRKNVAVEVNRLNLAEIGQNKSKPKQQQLHAGEPGIARGVSGKWEVSSGGAGRSGCGLEGGEGGEMAGVSHLSTMATTNSFSANSEVMVESSLRQGEGHNMVAPRDERATPPQDSAEGGVGGGKGKSSLSKHVLLQKKSRTKLKKSKIDASVMTEISYGTEHIPDLYATAAAVSNHTPLTPPRNNYIAKGNHSNTYSSPPKDHGHHSSPLPKAGFVHKCTSPRLPFRNGTLNGVLNGYALPKVAAVLKGQSEPCPDKTPRDDEELFSAHQDGCYPSLLKGGINCEGLLKSTLAKQNGKRRGRRKMFLQQRSKSPLATPPVGTGKRGTRSFLVSIPRVHYHPNHPHSVNSPRRENSADSAMPLAEEVEEETRGGKSSVSTSHKRRSEIQLLFDGDKPPGQRISELEIPVFVAEDISNRSVSSTSTGSNALWLGSSTRKITPTEHFSYPLHSLSPTKRGSGHTNGVPTNSAADCNGFSSTLSPGHGGGGGGNHRKRTAGSTDVNSALSPPDALPPSKQPKVTTGNADYDPQLLASGKHPVGKTLGSVSVEERGGDCLPPHHPTAAEPVMEAELVQSGGEKHTHLSNSLMMLTSFPPRVKSIVREEGKGGGEEEGEEERGPRESSVGQSSTSFSAELVVFDSRGECLVRDGEYSILMQCSSGKKGLGLSTFEPLTWKTVFGKGEQKEVRFHSFFFFFLNHFL